MELKVYGYWGMPYLVFPCSRGRFFDYEGMGMIDAVAGFIDAGVIKIFTVDSVGAGMGRLLRLRYQPRLAVVVPAHELFP
jgi:esterase/lipase superfamily enzyme